MKVIGMKIGYNTSVVLTILIRFHFHLSQKKTLSIAPFLMES
jgi:hypothetical protein